MMHSKISVTVLTKNNAATIERTLESLKEFDEVLIYDNGSKDDTLSIAQKFSNTTIKTGPFLGFGPSHNKASDLAKNHWILSVDSDEVVTEEMQKEIFALSLSPENVYSFPRHNFYQKKWIRWCGWYPDRQYRLYHKEQTHFTDARVHEQIIVDRMHHIACKSALQHYSYDSISQFLEKMQVYSELFAKQNCGKKHSSPLKAVLHSFFTFFKCYFLKKGFLGGYEGFLISAYNAHTAFYKYLKLYEANLKLKNKNSE